MKTNYKHRTRVLLFGRWRMHTYRSHPERGYTRHWHLYGRDEDGKWERGINYVQLSAYRIRGWRLTASMTVADGALGSEELSFRFALPFLGQVFLGIGRAEWLVRALGLEYVIGKSEPDDCERSIEFDWHKSDVTIALWGHEDRHWGTWRYKYIDLKNKLLGFPAYSETPRVSHPATLTMPEGDYSLTVELFTSTWKRPRWPWATRLRRAEVKVLGKGGVPVPGKGENSWDQDDDAIFDMTCQADTVEAAVEQLRAAVLRDRERYGGPGWLPLNTTDDGGEEVK